MLPQRDNENARMEPTVAGDERIARAVRQALAARGLGPDEHIRSTVCDGWVTLEGEVERAPQRDEVVRVVARLAGVTGVSNGIILAGDRHRSAGVH